MPLNEIQTIITEILAEPSPATLTCSSGSSTDVAAIDCLNRREILFDRLVSALSQAFPIIAKILGSEVFSSLSLGFLRDCARRHPLPRYLGVTFPDYVGRLGLRSRDAYIADVARLEAMILTTSKAATSQAAEPVLTCDFIDPRYLDHVAQISTSTDVFMSRTGAVSIWRHYTSPAFQSGPCCVSPRDDAALIAWLEHRVKVIPLELRGCDIFLALLMRGHTLREARDGTCFVEPGFEFSSSIKFLAKTGALRSLIPGPSRCPPPGRPFSEHSRKEDH